MQRDTTGVHFPSVAGGSQCELSSKVNSCGKAVLSFRDFAPDRSRRHVVEFASECLLAIRDADRWTQGTNSRPKMFFGAERRASDGARLTHDDANASLRHG